eukprot:g29429.t1
MLSQPVPTLSQPQWHLHGSKDDRLLQRGALDAAQCHRAFGQVLLRLFPQGAPAGRPAALLDRAFSERAGNGCAKGSESDGSPFRVGKKFHFFVLRGLQPILTGAAQQSPAAQAAALQSAQLAAQAFATQTKMPTPELTKTPPPEAASPSSAWTPQGLKDRYEIPEVYESLGSGAFGTVLKVRHTGTGELRACKAVQLQNGSEALKDACVLHRDLKPENVLFLTRAPDSPLKVIDFGLSDTLERLWQNATEDEGELAQRTRASALGAVARMLPKLPGGLEILATKVTKEVMQRAGTPHYMAPEVYEGQYGEKADQSRIGVMIFEMLTNRHPFYTLGNDLETVRRRILAPRGADFVDASWRQVSPSALSACSIALE